MHDREKKETEREREGKKEENLLPNLIQFLAGKEAEGRGESVREEMETTFERRMNREII